MTSRHFLAVVALAQGALLIALIILIILNRWFRLRRKARVHPRVVRLNAAMQRWALGSTDLGSVLVHLARLPIPLAVDALVSWSARVPGDRWRQLAAALRGHWWARIVRSNANSGRWWKRLEAARFFAVAATPEDTSSVLKLLHDANPAVHIAAVATLERVESAALTTAALERLPRLAPTVGAYYAGMLRRSRPVVVQLLLKMLRRSDDPALPRMTEFAARLNEPALRESLTALGAHPDPEVRVQAARGVGAFPHPASIAVLTGLVRDDAWAVRAQAVRSLGMIADRATLPLVRDALRDAEWWVRIRAGLALTRFGGVGRDVLLQNEHGPDQAARDMARLVLGLSPQALAEYAA
ncbi:MAG TPA: HEAT repeat domain-containing protein [Gemmatimonadales bacterium]|nr:HEAT repeat domain-containing protein [Gemmatimonadales bacterium]